MAEEKRIESLLRNLEAVAKRHRTEVEIKLDGETVAAARLEHKKEGGLKAIVGIRNIGKALGTHHLLKAALSLYALKAGLGKHSNLDIEFESGMIKSIFSPYKRKGADAEGGGSGTR